MQTKEQKMGEALEQSCLYYQWRSEGGFRGFQKPPLGSVIHYCNVSQQLSDQAVMKVMVDHEYW